MANRVATSAALARVGTDLSRTYNKMADVQSQITTGKRLQRPSDNPSGVANALEGRATQRRMEQHAANATDAAGWLKVTDDTLVGLQEQAIAAKSQMTAAVNGAGGASALEAIAADLDQVKAAMVQLANSTYQGRSIFGGTAAVNTAAYSTSGVYNGDAGVVNRTVDDGVTLQVNQTGTDIFGTRNASDPLKGDMFQVLDAMSSAARSGSPADMTAASAAFQTAVDRMSEAQIRVGGASVQVENTINRNESMMLDVKDRLASIEDVDLAEAIIGLRSNEAAYQAALGVTARVIQPSLLDFLR
jgi:flagellar hook-associated protein 3 FlgL